MHHQVVIAVSLSSHSRFKTVLASTNEALADLFQAADTVTSPSCPDDGVDHIPRASTKLKTADETYLAGPRAADPSTALSSRLDRIVRQRCHPELFAGHLQARSLSVGHLHVCIDTTDSHAAFQRNPNSSARSLYSHNIFAIDISHRSDDHKRILLASWLSDHAAELAKRDGF